MVILPEEYVNVLKVLCMER